jgi:putative transposase
MARPARLGHFAYTGPYVYFITACTHLRRPLFIDPVVTAETLAQFRIAAKRHDFAILAYCLMPDHVHLLAQGLSDDSSMTRFVRIAKQLSGFRYSGRKGGEPLWQDGYFERVLRTDENVRSMARYIVENPVRAGLVTSALVYPYVGSELWTIDAILESRTDGRTR